MQSALEERHAAALEWFAAHEGNEVSWPEPLDGFFLANKAKGIHKPAGSKYALSIRQSLTGNYDDKAITLKDGLWSYRYFQEGSDPSERDKYFTNRALMACWADSVPIGVILQTKEKPNPRYNVIGLGNVVDWKDGYFEIREHVPEKLVSAFEQKNKFDHQDDADTRVKTLRAITARQGQPAFREKLLRAYGHRCAVTGCAVIETLEAAHILPYKGIQTNHVQNGILLRSDLHILFDLGLMDILPEGNRVRFHPSLSNSHYEIYDGTTIYLPESSKQPSREALESRLLNFAARFRSAK